jgi:hypothetical protein
VHAGVRGAAGPAYWHALLRGAPAGPPAMFAAVLAAAQAAGPMRGRLAGGRLPLDGAPPVSGPAPADASGQAGGSMGSQAAHRAGQAAHGGGRASAAELEAAIAGVVAELVGARVAPVAPLAGQGLDSLAALELRRQLEARPPAQNAGAVCRGAGCQAVGRSLAGPV